MQPTFTPWIEVQSSHGTKPVRLCIDSTMTAWTSGDTLFVISRGGEERRLTLSNPETAHQSCEALLGIIAQRESTLRKCPSLGTLGRHLELISRQPGASAQHLLVVMLTALEQAGASSVELEHREGGFRLLVNRLGMLHDAGMLSHGLGVCLAECLEDRATASGMVMVEGRIGGPMLGAHFTLDDKANAFRVLKIERVELGEGGSDLESLGVPHPVASALRERVTQGGHLIVLASPTQSIIERTVACLIRECVVAWGDKAPLLAIGEGPIRSAPLCHAEVVSGPARAPRIAMAIEDGVRGLFVNELSGKEDLAAVSQAIQAGMTVITTMEATSLLEATSWAGRILPQTLGPRTTLVLQRLEAEACPHCSGQGCGRCHGSGITGHRLNLELIEATQLVRATSEGAKNPTSVGRPQRYTGP